MATERDRCDRRTPRHITRRSVLYGGTALFLTGCADGCDRDGTLTMPADGAAPPAPSPIGYSNVATLTAHDVRACAAVGLTLVQAELVPFDFGGADVTDVGVHLPRITGAVTAARQLGLVFVLTIVNWNGARQRAQSTLWFRDALERVIQEIGPSGVWGEGVSEPDATGKSQDWVQWFLGHWPGVKVVNAPGGRGHAPGGDILDWHYCSYAGLLAGVRSTDRLHSTDCTGLLGSQLTEAQVKDVTRVAAQGRRKLIVYDTSNAPGMNLQVVRWMGEALRG